MFFFHLFCTFSDFLPSTLHFFRILFGTGWIDFSSGADFCTIFVVEAFQRSQVQTQCRLDLKIFLLIFNSDKKKTIIHAKITIIVVENIHIILLLFVNVNKAHYPYFLIRCWLQSWLWMSGLVILRSMVSAYCCNVHRVATSLPFPILSNVFLGT